MRFSKSILCNPHTFHELNEIIEFARLTNNRSVLYRDDQSKLNVIKKASKIHNRNPHKFHENTTK